MAVGDERRFSIVVTPPTVSSAPTLLEVAGPVDAHTVRSLVAHVEAVTTGTVVVDLSDVTLLDTSALERLVAAVEQAATRDVDVRFRDPSPMVERISRLDAHSDRIVHRHAC